MSKTSFSQAFSLNLSARYAPNWGTWEAARELICNAKDASPDYKLTELGPDTLIVETPAPAPTLAQLFVVGEGTKSPGGDSIGQFGEGFKLAALTATRAVNGSLTVELDGTRVTFAMRPNEALGGTEVLTATVEQDDTLNGVEGCRIKLTMPGAGHVWKGRILDDATNRALPKVGKGLRIYCKGVFITDLEGESLADYNLNDLDLNRDRNMMAGYQIRWPIMRILESNSRFDADLISKRVMETTGEFANVASYMDKLAPRLRALWVKTHGDSALLRSKDQARNEMARRKGYEPRAAENDLVLKIGLPTVDDMPARVTLTALEPERFAGQIAFLRRIDHVAGFLASVKVNVFGPGELVSMGFADMATDTVWLSDQLFMPGRGRDLMATYIHEQCHLLSRESDCTRAFESSLDFVGAALALELLEGTK